MPDVRQERRRKQAGARGSDALASVGPRLTVMRRADEVILMVANRRAVPGS